MESDLPKDELTQELRQQILQQCDGLREKDGTEPDLTALSYEGEPSGDRSVWVNTYNHEVDGIFVDLEERLPGSDDRTTIRQIKATSSREVVEIIRNWLVAKG